MSSIGLSCPNCGSKDIEFHESAGHAACVECGTLLEENTIVSSIEFQESGDRSHVIGQFVSVNNANKPSTRNRGRYGFSRDSRDATLQNARRIILQVASGLRLPSYYVERAYRLYSLGTVNIYFCQYLYRIKSKTLIHLFSIFSFTAEFSIWTTTNARNCNRLIYNLPPRKIPTFINRFQRCLTSKCFQTRAIVLTIYSFDWSEFAYY